MTNSSVSARNISKISSPVLRRNEHFPFSLLALKKLSTSELLERQSSQKSLFESITSGKLKLPDNGAKVLQTLKNIEYILNSRQTDTSHLEKCLEELSFDSKEASLALSSKSSNEVSKNKDVKKKGHIEVLELSEIVQEQKVHSDSGKEKDLFETIELLVKGTLYFHQKQWREFSRSMNWELRTENGLFSDSDSDSDENQSSSIGESI